MGIARTFFSVGGKSQTLLAISFLVPVVPAMGQVHIRESVTIAPGESKKVRVGITHSLRYEFYWSGGDSAEVEYYNLDCSPDTIIWSQSSPIVVELDPAEAGVYVFKPWMKYNMSSPPPSIYVAFNSFSTMRWLTAVRMAPAMVFGLLGQE